MMKHLYMHAKFVDFTRREAAEFRDVEYFVERYGAFLTHSNSMYSMMNLLSISS